MLICITNVGNKNISTILIFTTTHHSRICLITSRLPFVFFKVLLLLISVPSVFIFHCYYIIYITTAYHRRRYQILSLFKPQIGDIQIVAVARDQLLQFIRREHGQPMRVQYGSEAGQERLTLFLDLGSHLEVGHLVDVTDPG